MRRQDASSCAVTSEVERVAEEDGTFSKERDGSGAAEAASVLVVEDDRDFAGLVADALAGPARGVRVQIAGDVAEATRVLRAQRFDLVLLDRGLPDGDGLAAMRGLVAAGIDAPFLLLTADASAGGAVEALKSGAADYLVKGPDALARLEEVAAVLLRRARRTRPADAADALVGGSAAIDGVRVLLRRYARSRASVLVEGETGVGKELVARALHLESPRAAGPFVAINCGALPEHLVESELFGHVRGAFTGAHRDHAGLVEHAEHGTLFLDEIEDLPASLQGKLLRLLQEAEYRPVGATRARRANVRVVAASNAELQAMVDDRRFRRDLFYRLNVLRIVVPPLRERLDDLPVLLAHLAAPTAARADLRGALPFVTPSAEQLALLREHPWPGNVRELANLVERAAVVAASIGWAAGWSAALAQLRAPLAVLGGAPRALPPALPECDAAERAALLALLERHRWRRAAAARELGISRVTLWRRMRRAGLGCAAEARGDPGDDDGAD